MSGHEIVEHIRTVIDYAAFGIEILAVLMIVTAVIAVTVSRGTIRYVFEVGQTGGHQRYGHQLGNPLLLGLDLLVAGNLVRTVALELTLSNIAALGLLALARTFLSWSLAVEMEGGWPWEAKSRKDTPG
jgi:uncharacterized membrane protein